MGSASECWAHGRSVYYYAQDRIWDRYGCRWFFVLPLVVIGSTVAWHSAAIYGMMVAGWAFDDSTELLNPPERALPIYGVYSVQAYTWVVLTTIIVPRSKKLAAMISALLLLLLLFLCDLWLRRSSGLDSLTPWIYFFFVRDFFDRHSWPWLLVGIAFALVLVSRRLRPQMLLALPAYYFGFSLSLISFSLILSPLLDQMRFGDREPFDHYYHLFVNVENFAGGLGAIAIPALMCSINRVRTAIVFFGVTLVYMANSLVLYLRHLGYPNLYSMDGPGIAEPGFVLGVLAAIGFVILRGNRQAQVRRS